MGTSQVVAAEKLRLRLRLCDEPNEDWYTSVEQVLARASAVSWGGMMSCS